RLGLADPRLALQQQRPAEQVHQPQRHDQLRPGDVALVLQTLGDFGAVHRNSNYSRSSQGLALGSTSLLAATRSRSSRLVDARAKPWHDDRVWCGDRVRTTSPAPASPPSSTRANSRADTACG